MALQTVTVASNQTGRTSNNTSWAVGSNTYTSNTTGAFSFPLVLPAGAEVRSATITATSTSDGPSGHYVDAYAYAGDTYDDTWYNTLPTPVVYTTAFARLLSSPAASASRTMDVTAPITAVTSRPGWDRQRVLLLVRASGNVQSTYSWSLGLVGQQSLTVTYAMPPTPSFTWAQTGPNTVTVTNTTPSFNSASWDYAGVVKSSTTHTFDGPGTYTVTLSATLDGITRTTSQSVTVDQYPTVNLTATPRAGTRIVDATVTVTHV